MENLKKYFILMTLAVMAFQISFSYGVPVSASSGYTPGDVVINEVAWAGTADNWRDEWIELYNTTGEAIDLSGWYIEDDRDRVYLLEDGEIPARGYFLIADKEDSLSNVKIDAVISLSLVDTGNSLVLKNSDGEPVDVVNSSAGAWFAGNTSERATMERIDPLACGDEASNWASANSGNGAEGRNGADILGTPGGVNSVYDGEGTTVSMGNGSTVVYADTFVHFPVNVDAVEDLYAYGFEIYYDPEVLSFVESEEGNLLNSDGTETAFYAALVNGIEGSLVIGNARLVNPPVGVDGSGELFNLSFELLSEEGDTNLVFGSGSFLADSSGDIPIKLEGISFPLDGEHDEGEGEGSYSGSVTGLSATEGEDRYTINLTWQDAEADSYIVYKKMHHGEYAVLATTENLFFVDFQNIIPHLTYQYKVAPVLEGNLGEVVEVEGVETRGLKADNNRSDSVDGRDLENLARAFGSQYGDPEYNPLADTNFDGFIDGSDLIDLGLNFGLTY